MTGAMAAAVMHTAKRSASAARRVLTFTSPNDVAAYQAAREAAVAADEALAKARLAYDLTFKRAHLAWGAR